MAPTASRRVKVDSTVARVRKAQGPLAVRVARAVPPVARVVPVPARALVVPVVVARVAPARVDLAVRAALVAARREADSASPAVVAMARASLKAHPTSIDP